MGIIDILAKENDDQARYLKNLGILVERRDRLVEAGFYLEAVLLYISALEELLRLSVCFLENIYQNSNRFKANDIKDNVIIDVISIDFSALGLKEAGKLTLGELIRRYFAFRKNTDLNNKLVEINKRRVELLHKLLQDQNREYLEGKKDGELDDFMKKISTAARELIASDSYATKVFFEDLTRKNKAPLESDIHN